MKKNTPNLLVIYNLSLLLLCILASCGSARRSEPIMAKAMVKNEQIKKGEIVFMNNCQKCHPGGEAGVGPSLNNLAIPGVTKRFRVRSKAFLFGLGRMPSFKKNEISKEEMDNLIVYMKALRHHDESNN